MDRQQLDLRQLLKMAKSLNFFETDNFAHKSKMVKLNVSDLWII